MQILLIEDDITMARTIELVLKSEGIICDVVSASDDQIASKNNIYEYDIILLGSNGYSGVFQLRAAKVKVPILILSGIYGVKKRMQGINFGDESYIQMPFTRGTLINRINYAVKYYQEKKDVFIHVGTKLVMDCNRRTIVIDGKPLHLTGKEYQILEFLVSRRASITTKEMLLNHLYGGLNDPEPKILDVFVCKLRQKLKKASGGVNYIVTVWGKGHMLNEKVYDNIKTNSVALQAV